MSVASQSARPVSGGPFVDAQFDLPGLGAALWRKKWKILRPTILAALVTFGIVQLITPKYLSESRVLIEARDNIFLRPDVDKDIIDRGTVDQEAVASQVQLILSRDLASEVIAKLKLDESPEFDPVLNGISPIKAVLGTIGVLKNPTRMTPQERVLECLLRPAYRLSGGEIAGHRHRLPVRGSGACRARRQRHRRRLSPAPAGGEAGPGA